MLPIHLALVPDRNKVTLRGKDETDLSPSWRST
jgi:hypothetical protein